MFMGLGRKWKWLAMEQCPTFHTKHAMYGKGTKIVFELHAVMLNYMPLCWIICHCAELYAIVTPTFICLQNHLHIYFSFLCHADQLDAVRSFRKRRRLLSEEEERGELSLTEYLLRKTEEQQGPRKKRVRTLNKQKRHILVLLLFVILRD